MKKSLILLFLFINGNVFSQTIEDHYLNFQTINPEIVFLDLLNTYRKNVAQKINNSDITQVKLTERTMALATLHGEYLKYYNCFKGENLKDLKSGKVNPHWEYKKNPVAKIDLFTWSEKFADRIDLVVIDNFVIPENEIPVKYGFNECITALTFPSNGLLSKSQMKKYIRQALVNFHESLPHRKNIQAIKYNEFGFHYYIEEYSENKMLLVVTLNLAFYSKELKKINKNYYTHKNPELKKKVRKEIYRTVLN